MIERKVELTYSEADYITNRLESSPNESQLLLESGLANRISEVLEKINYVVRWDQYGWHIIGKENLNF